MAFWREWQRRRGAGNFVLLPAATVFGAAASIRRAAYRAGVFSRTNIGVPVVIVGNITAGGGGKTPLVIALTEELQRRGFRPGVAARGYGGDFSGSLLITGDTSWRQCGDEPLLIFNRTGAPVCVCKDRVRAAQTLAEAGCDIVICDDGMQHYALCRDMEICAVSAGFGTGNGWLLPAGPLREGAERLNQCDFVVCTGEGEHCPPRSLSAAMTVDGFYSLSAPDNRKTAAEFADKTIAAVAGIADPQKFFDSLRGAGVNPRQTHPLPDHGLMDERTLSDIDAEVIVMTEKDGLKYSSADSRLHVMRVSLTLPPPLADEAAKKITEFGQNGRKMESC